MTKEEAIQVLSMVEAHGTLVIQAKEMAIKALSEKDWKFYYDHGYAQAKRDLSENKGDLINRQAVLDAINTDFHEDLSQLEDAIKALPVVEPKPRTGRWIKNKYGQTVCSECQSCALEVETGRLVNRHLAPFETEYCPQCGAKMSEGSNKE